MVPYSERGSEDNISMEFPKYPVCQIDAQPTPGNTQWYDMGILERALAYDPELMERHWSLQRNFKFGLLYRKFEASSREVGHL